jgi:hypothetical protein
LEASSETTTASLETASEAAAALYEKDCHQSDGVGFA